MKNKWRIALLVGIVFLVAGCSGKLTYEAREINPEIDVCEICNMSVAHQMYATQLILKDGEVYTFDDIGCMIEMVDKGIIVQEENVEKMYVRDVETAEWVESKDAYYVYDEEIWTPMAYDVISFATKENAEIYIENNGYGELWNAEQMRNHHWGWNE